MKTLTRVRVSCYLAFSQWSVSLHFLADSQTNRKCHVFEKHTSARFRLRVKHMAGGAAQGRVIWVDRRAARHQYRRVPCTRSE